jgi:hypothetical protein
MEVCRAELGNLVEDNGNEHRESKGTRRTK